MPVEPPEVRSNTRVTAPEIVLSILVVFNLAIARPILDLLGKNPEFFIAHDLSGRDAVLFAALLTIGLPCVVGGLLLLARALRGGTWLHHIVFGLFCGVLVVQGLKSLDFIAQASAWFLLVISTAIGGCLAWLFRRSSRFRSFLSMGAFVPLLVLGVFVFGSRASDLISPTAAAAAKGTDGKDPAPVVMVVMDEFPVASLMDRTGHIDGRLFPNFERLLDNFTWFRDTTTVFNFTTSAVPALIDGKYPKIGTLPTIEDHPTNLFTLLAPQYELKVIEQITNLCPDTLCRDIGRHVSLATKWSRALSDLEVVFGHTVLPADMAASLPPVDQNWGGFGQPEGLKESMAQQVGDFELFERALEDSTKPQLYFLHLMIPHPPWRFLPSGMGYPETTPPLSGFLERPNGTKVWGNESWPVTQAYQRHLLQVGFADRLVGRLVDRLRAVGLYDKAMIVFTSDHGAVFRPGVIKRAVESDTLGDIAGVPLFIKRPGQVKGGIDDSPAQTIDILPTIEDVIGASSPDGLDGRSLFAPVPPGGVTRTIFSNHIRLDIEDALARTRTAARVKYRLFDLSIGLGGLFRLAPDDTDRFIGVRASALRLGSRFAGAARIASPSLYDDVDRPSGLVPAMVAGTLTASAAAEWPARIAVAVNGRVWAVTESFHLIDTTSDFYAMVPPEAFVDGSNRLELFVMGGDGSLAPVTIQKS